MRKLLTLIIALIAMMPLSNATVVTGACGDNLTWSLNTETGILTIEGEGAMHTNWNNTSSPTPWDSYKNYITQVILPEGITSVGPFAFYYCTGLQKINMPQNITSIGRYAFSSCQSLKTIDIPDGVTEIPNDAFQSSGLVSIELHDNVTTIAHNAFAYSHSLSSVTLGSGVTLIDGNSFNRCNVSKLTITVESPLENVSGCGINPLSCILYVPKESKELYANADWWKYFKEIRSIGSYKVVKFIDWEGTVLYSEELEEGSSVTPPNNPTREGYTFIGWDKDFSNITEDMIITAQYKINRYKVDFVDWDNTVLKSDSVDWNTSAIAPSNPSRRGYTFKGWDKEFEHIKTDLQVKALYEMGVETNILIRFTDGNGGSELLRQSVILKVPEAPEIEGFTFIGWQPVTEIIEDEIIIQAIYKSDTEVAPAVYINPSNSSQKLIREGNVYILRGEKTYTLTGQEVK